MGSTVRSQFSDVPRVQEMGLITGSFTITQFPDEPCMLLRFKAHPDNTNDLRIGVASNICPWVLEANDDTGWIAAYNMNQYYYQTITGTAYILYWLQK